MMRLRPHCSLAATAMRCQWRSRFSAFTCKLDDTALRRDGHELRDAHFDGLFDDPIHFVAAGDALHQHGARGQLGLHSNVLMGLSPGASAFDLQGGRVVTAAAVEQDNGAAVA